MKKILKDYFSFSAKETRAIIILFVLIIAFFILPYYIPMEVEKPDENASLVAAVKSLETDSTNNHYSKRNGSWQGNSEDESEDKPISDFTLFEFDPNTLDASGWKKLGLRDRTIQTILNYRNKGGRFRDATDIGKIWGLSKEEADRIVPYAKIASNNNNPSFKSFEKPSTPKLAVGSVNINTATIEELKLIPGIDHSLPYRMLNYRDRMGGFYNMQQVKESFGMTDSMFAIVAPYLKTDSIHVKKININLVTDFELSNHPYIPKEIAKAIVIYRQQHGKYSKVADIKKIIFLNEKVYQKIAPFLTTE